MVNKLYRIVVEYNKSYSGVLFFLFGGVVLVVVCQYWLDKLEGGGNLKRPSIVL